MSSTWAFVVLAFLLSPPRTLGFAMPPPSTGLYTIKSKQTGRLIGIHQDEELHHAHGIPVLHLSEGRRGGIEVCDLISMS